MSNPQHLQFSKEHEWLTAAEGGVSTIGITAHAADALGDIVYVQLPEVGDTVTAGETCGELESTKSVSDLYSPATGEVVEVNQAVIDEAGPGELRPLRGWLAVQGPARRRARGPAERRRVHRPHRRLSPPTGRPQRGGRPRPAPCPLPPAARPSPRPTSCARLPHDGKTTP